MLPEYKERIVKNFVSLMKECNINVLTKLLVEKKVFTVNEINKILGSNDARHNKRVFFFELQKKEQRAFAVLLECLRETGQGHLADTLQYKRTGAKVFNQAVCDDDGGISPKISVPIHVDPSTSPLSIKVEHSRNFFDTIEHNKGFEYYYSRAKTRGRALIINNYDFGAKMEYRNGATVDNNNLKSLFKQMGGWDIQMYENKTAAEMLMIIKNFAQDKKNKHYNVCFVIIMSHGCEINNKTIIYGIDGSFLYECKIQEEFNNEHCKLLLAKPKILIFHVCRGNNLDYSTKQVTETDSAVRDMEMLNMRTQEDMLIGYSTLLGYKTHRDAHRGSWYIEILCEKFMKYAHDTPVDDLLSLIDQGLRRRMSEYYTMQTAEMSNKGFKKLYLHPGIYYEDDAIKTFFN
ncbi:unnamed protein product [Acanthoscelides obtectus]|uniref:Caspase-3 n=1 Tax=Acanthoscelides obtectus TaxID=200917 RepID=A0A9P0K9B1_ACAOB|nr:unnamed protein product [Acanthoscelides obtectus]CAK1620222.1 Caspase-2 [Acanthoscelides obtectus]